jgi:lipoate-protein ligase B
LAFDARVLILAAHDARIGQLAAGLDALGWTTVTARDVGSAEATLQDLPLEAAVIDVCAAHGVRVRRKAGAPGLYLSQPEPGAKIASLGLKVSRGCSFHGIALNVDMDLRPFESINPCGYAGLAVTDLARAGPVRHPDSALVAHDLGAALSDHLQRE